MTKLCECGCGQSVRRRFLSGHDKRKNLIGNIFGRLTVVKNCGSNGKRQIWECVCSCGNKKIITTDSLTTGHTQSCGCLAGENRKNGNKIAAQLQREKTHCPHGHIYNNLNTRYTVTRGHMHRMCKLCRLIKDRKKIIKRLDEQANEIINQYPELRRFYCAEEK